MLTDTLWILLLVQIAMGGSDTLFHHELTQRLAWRPSQRIELRLHGARNLIYALVFLMLGISAPAGGWAAALMALLLVEAGITLWDFVEEDRSRALPASERVLHTLLTLNYGVVLAMLLPLLWTAVGQADALPFVWSGIWSALFVLAAFGVALSGLRDFAAAARLGRIVPLGARSLVAGLGTGKAVLVTGGTGFVGSRLIEALVAAGHQVTVLTRNPAKAARLTAPIRIITDLDQIDVRDRIDAIVNLAGESIAGGLWTRRRRVEIVESRVRTTLAIARLCARLDQRPAVLVNGSAIGFYGNAGDEILDEGGAYGPGFCGEVCQQWEESAAVVRDQGVRVVVLRIGLVLESAGGLLGNLLLPFELGMGGPIGNGTQWMSWIHRDDLVRLIAFAIADEEVSGVLNATAPNPVRNRDFARALGRALHRPAAIPLPALPLGLVLGDFAEELFLASQRVLPVKAIFGGFVFAYPTIGRAMDAIVGNPPATRQVRTVSALREARALH